jgi:hypothetical protein
VRVQLPEEAKMRFVGMLLAAVGLSSLALTAVVANAVFAPVPHKEKSAAVIGQWVTTVTRD